MKRPWLGPLLTFELIRTARRGRGFVVRALYLAGLLSALFVLYVIWFKAPGQALPLFAATDVPLHETQQFGTAIFGVFMAVQMLAVFVLTPLGAAGAIAEERERGTLEFLLATDLTDREVVFGKVLSRAANMALLLVAGLPVLALTQLIGGIDPALVLASFLAAGLAVLSLTAMAVWDSLSCETPLQGLMRTYRNTGGYLLITTPGLALPLPLFNFGNPIAAFGQVFQGLNSGVDLADLLVQAVLGYTVVHMGLTTAFVVATVLWLRKLGLRRPSEKPRERVSPAGTPRERPPIAGDVLMWKELSDEPLGRKDPRQWISEATICALLGAAPVASHLLWTLLAGNPIDAADVNVVVRLSAVPIMSAGILLAGLTAAGRFSREFERQTLDSLLTLPDRDTVLATKWWASIYQVRALGWALLALALVGLLTGGLNLWAVPLVVAACATYAVFFATLGLWLSLLTRSTFQARLLMAVVGVGFGLGVWGLLIGVNHGLIGSPLLGRALTEGSGGLVPPWTLWVLTFRPSSVGLTQAGLPPDAPVLVGITAGLLLYLLIAGVLWLAVRQRFACLLGPPPKQPGGGPP